MENRTTFSPFRGNCNALSKINEVPIDLALLAQETKPAFDGEPTRKFFPVRAQLTWFRLKNGNSGTIQTEIVDRDEFTVVVKATVTADGVIISNAFGSANAQNDDQDGMGKLIETAESRAISRALDFAGYGCQLDLNTFDDTPSAQIAQNPEPTTTAAETGITPPTPGTVTKSAKIDTNAPSEIIDIHDLEAAQEEKDQTEKKKPQRRSRKTEPAAPAPEATPITEPVEANTNEDESTAKQDEPDEKAAAPAPELEELPETEDSVAVPQEESQLTLDPELAPETGSVEMTEENTLESDEQQTPEEKVWNYMMFALSRQTPDPELDPRFFNAQNQDPAAYFVNGTKQTKMRNRDLQWALAYLEEYPDLIMGIKYPSSKGNLVGLTFGEIYETLSPENAQTATLTCKNLYKGNNAPAYAASLLLAEKIKMR